MLDSASRRRSWFISRTSGCTSSGASLSGSGRKSRGERVAISARSFSTGASPRRTPIHTAASATARTRNSIATWVISTWRASRSRFTRVSAAWIRVGPCGSGTASAAMRTGCAW
jgi:hypothetical protein